MPSKTPNIKRHKDSLKELEQHVSGHFGRRYSLTATESRYRPMSWQDGSASRTKGVESDLIVIFEDNSKPVGHITLSRFDEKPIYDSFAFSFNRISEDSDELLVSYSTKINDKIESGTPFSQETFRDLLRGLNRRFREEGAPKDRQTLLWRLQAVFLDNPEAGIQPHDESGALNKVLGKDKEVILGLKDRIREADAEWMEAHSQISALQSVIAQEANTSPEAMAIKRLQNEIKALKKTLARKEKESFKRRGGDKWVEQEKRADQERAKASDKLAKTVQKITDRLPSDTASRKAVRRWLEDNA